MWDSNNDYDKETGEVHAEMANVPAVSMGSLPSAEGGVIPMMVSAAQSLVRDQKALIAKARQIGGLLGKAGFYSFPAGGARIEGPSINLAEALAQEWGAMLYQARIQHAEVLAHGGLRVHLRATAADMKTLVAAEVDQVVVTSAAPGKFKDSIEQRERWNAMQIQSAASKILRNAIERVLPAWFVEPGFQAAKEADSKNALNGKSLPDARKGAIEHLKGFGCTHEELEQYTGQPVDLWAVPQIAMLRDLAGDLKRGTVSIEQWRNALQQQQRAAGNSGGNAAQTTPPARAALGLPAQTSAAPVNVPPAQAETRETVPAAAKPAEQQAPQQQTLSGEPASGSATEEKASKRGGK